MYEGGGVYRSGEGRKGWCRNGGEASGRFVKSRLRFKEVMSSKPNGG